MSPPLLFTAPSSLSTLFLPSFFHPTINNDNNNNSRSSCHHPYHHHHHHRHYSLPSTCLTDATVPLSQPSPNIPPHDSQSSPAHSFPTTIPRKPPPPLSLSKDLKTTINTLFINIQTSIRERNVQQIVNYFSQFLSIAGPRPRRCILTKKEHLSELLKLWNQSISLLFKRGAISAGLKVIYIGEEILPIHTIHRKYYVECLKVLVQKGKWNSLFYVMNRIWLWTSRNNDYDDHDNEEGRDSDNGPGCARPDERLVAMVANGCVEHGRVDLAVRFIREMEKRGVKAGVYCYSVLLKGYGRKKRRAMVEKIVSMLFKRSIQWDTILLNTVVDAFVRCDSINKAEQLIHIHSIGYLSNVRTFNTLVKGFAQKKMVLKAFHTVDTMKIMGYQPDAVTINSLILACVRTGKLNQAWELIDAQWPILMEQFKICDQYSTLSSTCSNYRQMVIALTTIVSGVAQSGKIDEALHMLTEMKARGAEPNRVTYRAILSACLRYNKVQQAFKIFTDMRKTDPRQVGRDSVTYVAMLVGLAQSGNRRNVIRAEKLLFDMSSEGLSPTETCYNAVMDGWVRAGYVGHAEKLMYKLKQTEIYMTCVPYTTLIKGYSQQSNFGKAKFWFQQVTHDGIQLDRICLNSFIAACCRAEEYNLAERTLTYMQKIGGDYTPNVYSYSPLLASKCRTMDLEAIFNVYKKMRSSRIRCNAYIVKMVMTCILAIGPSYIISGPRKERQLFLTENAIALLRDAFRAGIDPVQSMKWRRSLTIIVRHSEECRKQFDSLREPTAQTHGKVSEEIFRRHNWNPIESGWRIL